MPDRYRVFNDKETSRILKRAAELQKQTKSSTRTGLTLEEIRTIAEEAGIDPSAVLTAVAEIDHDAAVVETPSSGLWGAPTRVQQERTFPYEVSSEEMAELFVPALREAYGHSGKFEVLGQTLHWRSGGNQGESALTRSVSIRSENGRTMVTTYSRTGDWLAATLLLPVLTSPFVAGIVGKSAGLAVGWSVFFSLFILLFFASRWLYRSLYDSDAEKNRRALHNIDKVLRHRFGVAEVAEGGTSTAEGEPSIPASSQLAEPAPVAAPPAKAATNFLTIDEPAEQEPTRTPQGNRTRTGGYP
ncbi:MAG: hypothetical protein AAF752_13100 [Bacteroidota bacterium]